MLIHSFGSDLNIYNSYRTNSLGLKYFTVLNLPTHSTTIYSIPLWYMGKKKLNLFFWALEMISNSIMDLYRECPNKDS